MAKNKENKKYRLVIFDEISFDKKVNIILTKANVLIYGGAIFILIGIIVFLMFLFTPMKYLLPSNDNFNLDKRIVQNAIMIDSLEKEIIFRDNYYSQISKILNDEDIDSFSYVDTTDQASLLTQIQKDSILDELLVRNKNSLNEIRNTEFANVDNYNFRKPVSGVVSKEFDIANAHYGIDIVATENTPVLATLSGTVILATWSVETGNTIQIQHANNIISVYKHNAELLKKAGDRVTAGESIALVGNTGKQSTGPHLHFEIWQDGVPINPANYISF